MAISRGPALGLRPRILDRIQAQADHVWTPVGFLDLGPRAALDKALQRLTREKALTRIDRGRQYLPRVNALTGTLAVPGHKNVIDAVCAASTTSAGQRQLFLPAKGQRKSAGRDLLDSDRGNAMRRLHRILNDPTHGPILRADLKQGIHTLPIWMQSTVRDLFVQGADAAPRVLRRVANRARPVARSRV